MTAGTARGITDPINLPLLLVLAKLEPRGEPATAGDLSTVMTSASNGAIWRPDGFTPPAGDCPIMDGIRVERQVVPALRDSADLVIDTSVLTAADLKRLLTAVQPSMRSDCAFCHVFRLSPRHPTHADLIFDVRFLDNPDYVLKLRPKTRMAAGSVRGNPT
jgi:hypothetical protein